MKEEEEERKKILVKEGLGPWHGRATIGTGRAHFKLPSNECDDST